jgi:hypothetical protein
MYRIVD